MTIHLPGDDTTATSASGAAYQAAAHIVQWRDRVAELVAEIGEGVNNPTYPIAEARQDSQPDPAALRRYLEEFPEDRRDERRIPFEYGPNAIWTAGVAAGGPAHQHLAQRSLRLTVRAELRGSSRTLVLQANAALLENITIEGNATWRSDYHRIVTCRIDHQFGKQTIERIVGFDLGAGAPAPILTYGMRALQQLETDLRTSRDTLNTRIGNYISSVPLRLG